MNTNLIRDIYDVMQYCFSLCPTRNGHFTFDKFNKKMYKLAKKREFGLLDSTVHLCCLWLKLIENGAVPNESFEDIVETCIGFEKLPNDKMVEIINQQVKGMSLDDRCDFIHNKAVELAA